MYSVAAAAVTAKIQALDAVAENLGIDAHDISQEEQRKKEREREKDRDRRDRDRDRRRGRDRSRDRRSRDKDRDSKHRVKTETKESGSPPPQPPMDSSGAIPVPPTSMPPLPSGVQMPPQPQQAYNPLFERNNATQVGTSEYPNKLT